MTIKLAFKKDNPNLVFDIQEIERVNVAGGIVEYYSGDLIDTSTIPDTRKEFKAQVMAFESEWVEVPVDLGSTGDINNQAKTATPSTSAQTIKPDAGYTGLSKVTVNAVDASIDADIVAGNIKKDVNILGVTGNYIKPEDANLVPENIKNGVTIYDVTGSLTDSVISANANPLILEAPNGGSASITTAILDIKAPVIIRPAAGSTYNWSAEHVFDGVKMSSIDLTGSDFTNCVSFDFMFNHCTNLTEIIGTFTNKLAAYLSLDHAFTMCSSLTSLNLRSLQNTNNETVNLFLTFYGCSSLQHLDIGGLDLTHTFNFNSYTFGEGADYVPLDCEIIVKDADSKAALLTVQPGFTNVKTVAEYEA